jgi:hypothetical protein
VTTPFPTLEAVVAALPSCHRTAAGLFTRLEHRPTGQSIHLGYRCFACSDEVLLTTFLEGGLAAVAALPRATDDQGRPQVSRVRLDLAYTLAGGVVGAQPVRYRAYTPEPAAPAQVAEGADAVCLEALVRGLDQSAR